jgi:hypothetical protein
VEAMRLLTFKGFLHRYVRELSNLKSKTNDIKLLANEASYNSSLVEPLVLYALSVGKYEHLLRVAVDPHLQRACQRFFGMNWEEVVLLLHDNNISVPNEFRKAYRSYVWTRDKQKHADHTKSLMLNRTRELQSQKNVTTYRLYTDLKLNHGNVHDYIKNGNVSKVSLDVAEIILTYLEAV